MKENQPTFDADKFTRAAFRELLAPKVVSYVGVHFGLEINHNKSTVELGVDDNDDPSNSKIKLSQATYRINRCVRFICQRCFRRGICCVVAEALPEFKPDFVLDDHIIPDSNPKVFPSDKAESILTAMDLRITRLFYHSAFCDPIMEPPRSFFYYPPAILQLPLDINQFKDLSTTVDNRSGQSTNCVHFLHYMITCRLDLVSIMAPFLPLTQNIPLAARATALRAPKDGIRRKHPVYKENPYKALSAQDFRILLVSDYTVGCLPLMNLDRPHNIHHRMCPISVLFPLTQGGVTLTFSSTNTAHGIENRIHLDLGHCMVFSNTLASSVNVTTPEQSRTNGHNTQSNDSIRASFGFLNIGYGPATITNSDTAAPEQTTPTTETPPIHGTNPNTQSTPTAPTTVTNSVCDATTGELLRVPPESTTTSKDAPPHLDDTTSTTVSTVASRTRSHKPSQNSEQEATPRKSPRIAKRNP